MHNIPIVIGMKLNFHHKKNKSKYSWSYSWSMAIVKNKNTGLTKLTHSIGKDCY